MQPGQSVKFQYTGKVQQIELLPGIYLFECYGASGGGGNGASFHENYDAGGLGGYTSAIMAVLDTTIVYCYVGGAGYYGAGTNQYGGMVGGWNGGGNGGNSTSGSGGGATDFRVVGGAWNDTNSLRSRFLVAGGGGGSDNKTDTYGDDGSGGSGGGVESEGCWISGVYHPEYRATQTTGYALGQGQHVSVNTDTGGAGGGWYGGICSLNSNGGAGGGSSYIKGFPGCNTQYHDYQFNIEYRGSGHFEVGGNLGNGYAVITLINLTIMEEPRLNSNIYKNIFAEEVMDMEYITYLTDNVLTSINDVHQENHSLKAGDFVYKDSKGLYHAALAEDSEKSKVIGMVYAVASQNVFTLMTAGMYDFDSLPYDDTTVMYISDKVPGKAVHFSQIDNDIFVPIAVYADKKIIINMQQGSIGELTPYSDIIQLFDRYTKPELDETVGWVLGGV